MAVRYEWADENQRVLNMYLEEPWTWAQYHAMLAEVMPMLAATGNPCATVVDTTRMGPLPKDGSIMQTLLQVEKEMPENVFASAIVGSPYIVRVFMEVLMKLRPRAKSIALFAGTYEEALAKIDSLYQERFPDQQIHVSP